MPPTVDRPEIAGYCAGNALWKRSSVPAETCKIEFMQEGGVEFGEFVPLQSVDDLSWRRGVESFELFCDPVQPIDGFSIDMLVVALDQTRRDPIQRPRPAEQWCDIILHRNPLHDRIRQHISPLRGARRSSIVRQCLIKNAQRYSTGKTSGTLSRWRATGLSRRRHAALKSTMPPWHGASRV